MIMNPDAPSDRPNANAQPPEPPAASQAAYPSDLAALVLTRWHEATVAGQIDLPPPATSALVDVLSICYKATLLREEGRPVTFRLALSEPDAFAPAAGPPSGLHRLVFARPLPFDEHELRRLAPAVVFSRSLVPRRSPHFRVWLLLSLAAGQDGRRVPRQYSARLPPDGDPQHGPGRDSGARGHEIEWPQDSQRLRSL